MSKLLLKFPALLLTVLVGLICSSSAFGAATIVIQNNDAPNVGFNDSTPASPIGGNGGTTVGQQRLNAFQFAANVWGATLTSGPTITIRASWAALPCALRSGTLGAAGATTIRGNFVNAPFTGTWYPAALANALVGSDSNPSSAEITAQFNMNVGTTGCLESAHWYYGLDNNHGVSGIDLVTVLLHEFGHGLGFASFTDESTGTFLSGFPSVFDKFLLDNSTGKTWAQMTTDAERKASAINTNNLVWNGANVTSDAGSVITAGKDSSSHPRMYAPNPIEGGSSVSHWATTAFPDQLMEPNISNSLTHNVGTPDDLTFSLLKDIGWCTSCPPPPPPTPTPTPPANDSFANAQVISGCAGTVTGTNIGATRETGEPSHDPFGDPGGGSVWYQWQSPSTGSVTMTTAGSNIDSLLAVYTGSNIAALTSLGKNDDANGSTLTSSVTFNATAGTIYKIAVDGFGGETGSVILNWTASGCTNIAPTLLVDQGSANRAVAVDSVNRLRDPFPIIGLNNFSVDQRTRVTLIVYNLGLPAGSPPSAVTVKVYSSVAGLTLPVESIGQVTGVTGASYVVVRLTDQLPAGDIGVSVTAHGAESNVATINVTR